MQVVSRDAVVRRLREEIVSLELQRQQLEAKGMVTTATLAQQRAVSEPDPR